MLGRHRGGEWRRIAPQRGQQPAEQHQGRLGESGADVPGVGQFATTLLATTLLATTLLATTGAAHADQQ
jgi:hypothetical protein